MKKLLFLIISIFIYNYGVAQKTGVKPSIQKPKLVVGIVVDQMKYDYVFRYWDKLGEGGFKRLTNEGMFCKEVHYNYVPTYTGPGHASIYTGTTPATHGIVANNWFDREKDTIVYCTDDKSVKTLGANNNAGAMSPVLLQTTTIGDELKISSNFKSKVIGIALKDRGAILPAGHSGNAAYWWDALSANWITSTYYMKDLPKWVVDFNSQQLPNKYLSKNWNTILPLKDYTESTPDDTPYEGLFVGESKPVFPHNLSAMNSYEVLKYSPWGNTLTNKFAQAAIIGENLGAGDQTDMITISFSSTDYVGHKYGTHAVETEDVYLQLDKELEEFLKFLDTKFGKQNVLVFLTADHAAIPNPQFLSDNKIPAGYFNSAEMLDSLKRIFVKYYQDSTILASYENGQIYFDMKAIEKSEVGIDYRQLQANVADFCTGFKGVKGALTALQLAGTEYTRGINKLVQMGFNAKRSGDVVIQLEPGYIEWAGKTGTTHGSPYTYDTHVPLWFYGGMVNSGSTSETIEITDIAATLANLLNIDAPNGSIGKPIKAIVR